MILWSVYLARLLRFLSFFFLRFISSVLVWSIGKEQAFFLLFIICLTHFGNIYCHHRGNHGCNGNQRHCNGRLERTEISRGNSRKQSLNSATLNCIDPLKFESKCHGILCCGYLVRCDIWAMLSSSSMGSFTILVTNLYKFHMARWFPPITARKNWAETRLSPRGY